MNDDEKAFLAAIDANPEDEAVRGIYADWLDERDRPEEAERQRKHLEAVRFLGKFTDGYRWKYDDETDERVGDGPVQHDGYAEIMQSVEWWRRTVVSDRSGLEKPRWGSDDPLYGLGGSISFNTDDAPEMLSDPEVRREFWEAFRIVTGVEAPESLRTQDWYRCAC